MKNDPTKSALRGNVVRGAIWSGSGIAFRTLTQLVVSTLLARMLTPEDFGLVAYVTVFTAFGQLFVDGGFGAALIQKKELTPDDKMTMFIFNVFVSIVIYLVIFYLSPVISSWLKQPSIEEILRVLGLVVPIASLGQLQMKLMHRDLNFKAPAILMNVSTLAGGIVGIACALTGQREWSLVYMLLTIEIIKVIGMWVFGGWRFGGSFRVASLVEMGRFGVSVFASRFLIVTFNNIYTIVIGTLYSSAQLGFYSRAHRYQSLPSNTIAEAAKRTLFSALSRLQDDRPRFISVLSRSQGMIALIIYPIMALLFAAADHLVAWILTEKWLPLVPLLRPLCIIGLTYPIALLNLTALNAIGKSDKSLRLQTLRIILLAVAIIFTWNLGVLGLVYGQVVSAVIWAGCTIYSSKSELGYVATHHFRDTFLCCISAALMVCIMTLVFDMLNNSHPVETLVASIIGCATYACLCYMTNVSAFVEAVRMGTNFRYRRRQAA